MRLLDLFCGAGGASMGYYLAGFDVVGVDIINQPRYPFKFIKGDALEVPLDGFDVIHASPPCQAYSQLHYIAGKDHPKLIELVRDKINHIPYVIENVINSPLVDPICLCGSMFNLYIDINEDRRWLKRHRLFESNVDLKSLKCTCRGKLIAGVYGTGSGANDTQKKRNRGYKLTKPDSLTIMDIDWMNRAEISQAIPPAYTKYIGLQLIKQLSFGNTPLIG